MGYTRFRKTAFTLVVASTAITAATVGLNAFSDVPRGMPFTPEQAAQLSTQAGGQRVSASDQEFLGRASKAFNEIAQGATPAVVSISTIRRISPREELFPGLPGTIPGLPEGGMDDETMPPDIPSPHRPPGRPDSDGNGASQDPRALGIGSGIIIRKDGLVLTNNHVVENAERVTVTFDEKHRTKAHVVGTDPKTDLAVLQLDGPKKDYPVIRFGDSDQIRAGDWAIAIGSPFGLNRSVSFGIISAKGRAQMGILDTEDFIQTDAAINPGSSGGPLLNAQGELIGVNTAIFSQGGGNMGIGFAIPSKIAKEITDEIVAKGHVSRGWAGLMAQDLDTDLAKYFKVPVSQGALISEVVPSGPAGRASLQSGDIVTKFNNQPVDGAGTLKSLVGKTKAGSNVILEIVRDGKPQSLTMAVQEQPEPKSRVSQQAGQAGGKKAPAEKKQPAFGLAVEDVPTEISHYLNLPAKEGTIVVGVNPGSPAFDAGIGPGDIILKANRDAVHGAKEFKQKAKDLRNEDLAVLYVQRGPAERIFVPIKLKDDTA